MAVTRINNNQITDSSAGNVYVGINASTKVQDYSITAGKIANSLVYGSDLTVSGNLTVNGQTTTIDTVSTVIEDPVIVLAANQTGSPAVDIGFIGERGDQNNIAFVWDESSDEFVTAFTTDLVTNTTITIASYANFHTNDANIGGNITINGTTSLVGNISSALNVTGNITGGNLLTPGVVTATGNVSGGNVTTAGQVVATGNVSGGNLTTAGITSTGSLTASTTINATGNITGGNLSAGSGIISTTGNINGANVNATAGITAGTTINATGNVTGGNLTTAGITSTGSLTASTTINATGNVTGGNLTTAGITSTGSLTASTTINATGNITGGNVSAGSGIISTTGNINGGNVNATAGITAGTTIVATGNITGGNVTTAGITSTGSLTASTTINATGNITGGNVSAGSGIISTTGNINGGNLNATTGVTATTVTATGNISGGNISSAGALNVATLETTGNALIGGNLIVQGNITYINIDDLRVEDPIIILGTGPNGAPLSSDDGLDRGVFMEYYKSGLGNAFMGWDNSTGNMVIASSVNFTANDVVGVNSYGTLEAGNLYIQSAVSTGNVTGGNITTAGQVTATGNVSGGNITTAGQVVATGNVSGSNLNISGNIVDTGAMSLVTGASGNINLAPNGTNTLIATTTGANITGTLGVTGNITGGNLTTAGQVTATGNINGTGAVFSGNVTASNFIGNISGNIDAGGANTNIQFNDNNILEGSAAFTFDKTSNAVVVSGNITGGNLSAGSGIISTTGNINGANVNATSGITAGTTVIATGNVSGGNLTTVGQVSATGNVTGGNVVATALVTGANVTATANVTGANVVGTTSGTFANIRISTSSIDSNASRITINGADTDVDFAVDGDTVANVFYVDAGTGTASFGTSTQTTNAVVAFNATNSVLMPVGNTSQRPGTGVTGMLRFNTIADALEVYDNSQWTTVGVPSFTVIADEQFAGDGSTVAYTLGSTQTTASCIVSINGVVQIPTIAYSVSGTTLTFTEAPEPGDIIDVRQLTTTTTVTTISNVSGNASIGVSDTTNDVSVTGDLVVGNIVNSNANGVGNIGSSSGFFNTIFATATSAQYADLAEKYVADAEYAPGTVVVFGGVKEVTVTSTDADRAVAGVVSTNPSYIMNAGLEAEHVATVALTGRVPTRVTGSVRKGDLMVSAGFGLARAEQDPRVGTVIGKALENYEGTEGVIEVVVGRV
jgi:hypothetical protein